MSDLHLERHPDLQPQAASGVDLLVLAGDVGSYQRRSLLPPDPDFGLGRFSPLRPGALWPRVLFVPGNHEYDALPFAATHDRLRGVCERLDITWLERETVEIDGVRFVGTTLWSDFDAIAARQPTLQAQLQQRDKALRAADFYLAKNTTLDDATGAPLLAADLRPLGQQCQAWLRSALAEPHAGPTVVVTHFAPTLRSADPRYGISPGTAGFCNALDDLLGVADLWMHGHLHCPFDYRVEAGDGSGRVCRVVANPLGYAEKGEQAAFKPRWAIEVPATSR